MIAFHVVDSLEGDTARGDFTKKLEGLIRPLLKWTTQFSPNTEEPIAGMAEHDPLIGRSS